MGGGVLRGQKQACTYRSLLPREAMAGCGQATWLRGHSTILQARGEPVEVDSMAGPQEATSSFPRGSG